MSESMEFGVLEVPARIANLAFRMSAPRDWTLHDLPGSDVDFSVATNFFPLVALTAPWAAVALTVAARPGFENGTVQDWTLFLLDAQGIRPTAFGPANIGNVAGLAGVGRQQQEGSWLEVRFAFFEDGGRLVHLGLLAPEAIGASLEAVWKNALENFELEAPQGQTVPVGPGMGISAERATAEQDPRASRTAPTPAEPVETIAAAVAESSPPSRHFTDADLGYYAKAGDTATLDPEHPINARLRDQGLGLVPNLLETDLEAKTAQLGAGAIEAVIQVALGWHVNDDGRRTLLLDPAGKIQISLHVLAKKGRGVDQILADLQTEAVQSYVNPEFLRFENEGIWALAVRNISVNNEPIEQVHLLTAWRKDSAILRARVTCDPASTRYAVNYADLILRSAKYSGDEQNPEPEEVSVPTSEPPKSEGPPFWLRAQELEREDRTAEAEQLLRDRIPNIHAAIQIAELYRLRWIRLKESDPAKAREARTRAAKWADTYASLATSGGEGAALCYERDQFLRSLGPEPLQ